MSEKISLDSSDLETNVCYHIMIERVTFKSA